MKKETSMGQACHLDSCLDRIIGRYVVYGGVCQGQYEGSRGYGA